jgi:hypothetical protein
MEEIKYLEHFDRIFPGKRIFRRPRSIFDYDFPLPIPGLFKATFNCYGYRESNDRTVSELIGMMKKEWSWPNLSYCDI